MDYETPPVTGKSRRKRKPTSKAKRKTKAKRAPNNTSRTVLNTGVASSTSPAAARRPAPVPGAGPWACVAVALPVAVQLAPINVALAAIARGIGGLCVLAGWLGRGR